MIPKDLRLKRTSLVENVAYSLFCTKFTLSSFKKLHYGTFPKLSVLKSNLPKLQISFERSEVLSFYRNKHFGTFFDQYAYLYAPRTRTFQHSPFFLVQFLSILKTLPHLRHASRLRYFYRDYFNFVDYKRLKKTVFNRLITQRNRANKVLNPKYTTKFPRFDSFWKPQGNPTSFTTPLTHLNVAPSKSSL